MELDDRVGDLEDTVYGNGKEGLVIRVDRLEQTRLSEKDRQAIYVGPVVSGTIVAIIGVLVNWIVTQLAH